MSLPIGLAAIRRAMKMMLKELTRLERLEEENLGEKLTSDNLNKFVSDFPLQGRLLMHVSRNIVYNASHKPNDKSRLGRREIISRACGDSCIILNLFISFRFPLVDLRSQRTDVQD